MTVVSGYSDDLVYVETLLEDIEIPAYRKMIFIRFDDGTLIAVKYSDGGVWRISIVKYGSQPFTLFSCGSGNENLYTDRFETDAAVVFYDERVLDIMKGANAE